MERVAPRADEAAGAAFARLVSIMARLRGPDGCPWDREQTLASLRPFVLEETYEVLDALDRDDHQALRGELGDFLFEAVFLARIAEDHGYFTIVDSLQAISDKLIRRHPHVFGDAPGVDTPAAVLEQWEQIKSREQRDAGERRSVLRGLPTALPALLQAYEIGARVAAVGFDWSRVESVLDKLDEEVAELRRAVDHESGARQEEELGDLLFAIANLARKMGIEPEAALRKANAKFSARFAAVEHRLEQRGRTVHEATLDEMEAAWAAIKQEE